jgi:arsenate reductase
MEEEISQRLLTLGHPNRLALFRLLMRRYPDHVPAGELAQALDLKPSTLSAHLNALRQAGLVTRSRDGTSLRYAVEMDEAHRTVERLFSDCCRGRPEVCVPPLATRTPRVLFLCTGNSARSIFAEAILRDEGGARFDVASAGTHPTDMINPMARAVLGENDHPLGGFAPKSVDDLRDTPRDIVLTVCDRAANDDARPWPGPPVSAHWGIPDPASKGVAPSIDAFRAAYNALRKRIDALVALPVERLERGALQCALDDIGRMKSGEHQ